MINPPPAMVKDMGGHGMQIKAKEAEASLSLIPSLFKRGTADPSHYCFGSFILCLSLGIPYLVNKSSEGRLRPCA